MSTAAVMLVKDEADVIEATVRHLLTQVDHVIVSDNGSTDGTRDILAALPVELRDDPTLGYYQAAKTSALARDALEQGHEWVVPCDADEIWHSAFGRIADVLAAHVGVDIVTAEMYDHVPTAADDPEQLDPTVRIGWRRGTRGALPKVACRLVPGLRIKMGNHNARYSYVPVVHEWGVTIRHFPYRSPEQFVRKAVNGAAAYAAAPDIPEAFGGHWRGYGKMIEQHGEQAGHDWFHTWFWSDDPPRPPAGCRTDDEENLFYDPAPIGA